jgi:hypothetical protein
MGLAFSSPPRTTVFWHPGDLAKAQSSRCFAWICKLRRRVCAVSAEAQCRRCFAWISDLYRRVCVVSGAPLALL